MTILIIGSNGYIGSVLGSYLKSKGVGVCGVDKNVNNILIYNNKMSFKILKWKPINSNISKIINDEIRWYKLLKKRNN